MHSVHDSVHCSNCTRRKSLRHLVSPRGFEPLTFGSGGRRAIQLCHGDGRRRKLSLALLGRSNPAGVVAAGLLFGALRAGGQEMQAATDIPIDLILVIQALVVVFIAAPALIRAIYRVRTGEGAGQLTKGWATWQPRARTGSKASSVTSRR